MMRTVAALVAVAVTIVGSPRTTLALASDEAVTDVAVRFAVVNTNNSAVPCPSDGKTYVVSGHLTGPTFDLAPAAQRQRLVTVLLTGFDESEWTWRFTAVPGYDYPLEMAKLGQTSLSLDMLGYGASGHPNGQLVCWGSQADVLHQVISQLRAGTYHLAGGDAKPVAFSTVLVSARDSGPLAAVIDAYSWPGDIDGLSTQLFAHQGFTPYLIDIFARRTLGCALGGQNYDDPRDDPDDLTDDPSHGGGYIFFGPADAEFRQNFFDPRRADPDKEQSVIAGIPAQVRPLHLGNRR